MAQLITNRLMVAGQTDVGRVRTLNEDSMLVDAKAGLLAVADGMGGHDAGEVASKEVVTTLAQLLANPILSEDGAETVFIEEETEEVNTLNPDEVANTLVNLDADAEWAIPARALTRVVQQAITQTNARINQLNQDRGYSEGAGMGSTLVGLWLPKAFSRSLVFHVGDSRLYLMRGGRLKSVTQDHTLYQQWKDFGSVGRPPAQNVILQAMGPVEQVNPDVAVQELRLGDLFLLCSDGLTGMVTEEMIEERLKKVHQENLDEVCQGLIELAKARGGKDNVTVILALVIK